jgi:hypothetical protein
MPFVRFLAPHLPGKYKAPVKEIVRLWYLPPPGPIG